MTTTARTILEVRHALAKLGGTNTTKRFGPVVYVRTKAPFHRGGEYNLMDFKLHLGDAAVGFVIEWESK